MEIDDAINVDGLWKWYGRFLALKDIKLNVKAGCSTVLCGPSGSGKSTLLRCLNGLEEWDEGSILCGGQPVGRRVRDLVALRRRVGMVFQNLNLFPHLDAMSNVALAPRVNLRTSRADAEARAVTLLASVGLVGFERKYPGQLSGGQQQRVAIARALAMEPSVLLFDEPTSALDPESIGEVLDVMVALAAEGRTMIVVTHEMGFARKVCHDVVFMSEGRIVERAPPEQFFAAPVTGRARTFLSHLPNAG